MFGGAAIGAFIWTCRFEGCGGCCFIAVATGKFWEENSVDSEFDRYNMSSSDPYPCNKTDYQVLKIADFLLFLISKWNIIANNIAYCKLEAKMYSLPEPKA